MIILRDDIIYTLINVLCRTKFIAVAMYSVRSLCYYLRQGGYVVAFVGLSVSRMTQEIVDEFDDFFFLGGGAVRRVNRFWW